MTDPVSLRIAHLHSAEWGEASGFEDVALQELERIAAAGRAGGIEFVPMGWSAVAAEDCDAVLVGPVWDYQDHVEAFRARMKSLGSKRPVFNHPELLAWNIDKRYLLDLAEGGAPMPRTQASQALTEEQAAAAFDALEAEELIIKAQIGAGGHKMARLKPGEAVPDMLLDTAVLMQPFLPQVLSDGEVSLIAFDGVYSHAVRKRPKTGDYRVQEEHGGTTLRHVPDVTLQRAGELVLQLICDLRGLERPPLYARIDFVESARGPELMEVELIEPQLYLREGPHSAHRLVEILRRRLAPDKA